MLPTVLPWCIGEVIISNRRLKLGRHSFPQESKSAWRAGKMVVRGVQVVRYG
jgi:hypothetical protein